MSLASGGSSRIVNEPQMKILLWNCRGCNSPEFRQSFKDLIEWNKPSIVCLTETHIQSHYDLIGFVNLTDLSEISTDGYSSGASLMWKQEELTTDLVATTDQEIHVNIQVRGTSHIWLLSLVYASTDLANRSILLNNLETIARNHTLLWLLCGDFNEVTSASEKFGGRPINNTRANTFIQCLNNLDMIDLGFKGPGSRGQIKGK
uniref:Endonuclease/exonuclease/phosphatase domain-containing protein n=2 Tax=Nicotiana TaxID=4085 RepID=A0A1S3ZAM4_TOBAC|nr:PREDICTED: uncharacterized protein LOC104237683 [Nicotiana sylvestris]XP_016461404.1 PREDICTED: uncharacterized protein LOC107784743 [Nicotiana tabacum]